MVSRASAPRVARNSCKDSCPSGASYEEESWSSTSDGMSLQIGPRGSHVIVLAGPFVDCGIAGHGARGLEIVVSAICPARVDSNSTF